MNDETKHDAQQSEEDRMKVALQHALQVLEDESGGRLCFGYFEVWDAKLGITAKARSKKTPKDFQAAYKIRQMRGTIGE